MCNKLHAIALHCDSQTFQAKRYDPNWGKLD